MQPSEVVTETECSHESGTVEVGIEWLGDGKLVLLHVDTIQCSECGYVMHGIPTKFWGIPPKPEKKDL